MYENFMKLEVDKQHRILNAAFEEFARHGYKKASTSTICTKAKISKGALFHYFKNKHNLYFFLYDVGCRLIIKEMKYEDLKDETDFFRRLEIASEAKMRAMKDHPYIYAFFKKMYIEEAEETREEINHRLLALSSEQSLLIENINMKKFRKNIDLNLLSNLVVNFAVEYIQNILLTNEKEDITTIIDGFQAYMKMLKDNFYKEEYV